MVYIIGSPTRDRIVVGKHQVDAIGGTVSYAGLLIRRFGHSAGVVCKGDLSIKHYYDAIGIDTTYFLCGYPVVEFENRYVDDDRRQSARKGATIAVQDVPSLVFKAPAIMVGSVLDEVDPMIVSRRRSGVLMADIQGFLRQVSEDGQVFEHYNESARQVIHACDFLKADQNEARIITQAEDAETAAKILQAYGPKIVVVTRGYRGAVICHQNRIYRIKAFSVDSIDPTGAGDVFSAAFLVGYLRGEDIKTAGTRAACAAALSMRAFGCRAIPTIGEVRKALYGSG